MRREGKRVGCGRVRWKEVFVTDYSSDYGVYSPTSVIIPWNRSKGWKKRVAGEGKHGMEGNDGRSG